MNDLTVGIPIRSGTPQGVANLLVRAAVLDPCEVIVSINDPQSTVDLHSIYRMHPGLADRLGHLAVRIHIQTTNLGLYGNFRWLVNQAKSSYFLWFCEDDQPATSQGLLIEALETDPRPSLAVPRQELWNWDPELGFLGFVRTLDAPDARGIVAKSTSPHQITWPDPSWIFGTWRTDDLRNALPSADFDWLDFHLLIHLSLKRRIVAINCGPALIGTQPGRLPAAVGRWFNPIPFSLKAARESFGSGGRRDRVRIGASSAVSVMRASYFLNIAKLRGTFRGRRSSQA